MAQHKLSEGSLRSIMNGGNVENPVMQVLGAKRIASAKPGDKDRYRLLLSDGKYVISVAMLSTQLIAKISEQIPNFTIIRINQHVTSLINNQGSKNKRVLIILDLDILETGDKVGVKIGNPEQLPDTDNETQPSSSNGVASKPTTSSVLTPTTPQRAPVVNGSRMANPISSLCPYNNKWVIKARVMNKSSIRTWSNSRGEGKLFNIDLLDDTGEIRATVFRDLVDKYYDMIEVDKVYYISKCQVKVANKQFNSLKNDYEMTFNNDTVVEECMDEDTSIPQMQYSFVPIDRIAQMEVGSLIDVIGVCKSTSDVQSFVAKSSGRELKKCEVQVVDQTNTAVALTLWGSEAEKFDGSNQPILAIKGAKVGEFGGGKNISTIASSNMKINPDLPESHRLRGWFDNGGMQNETTNISARTGIGMSTKWMSFMEVQDAGLGKSEKGDYYQVKATILLMKHDNCLYKACPTDDCNKKIVDLQNGMYRCEKCNREYPNFKYRLLGQIKLADWGGGQWVSCFASEVEKILGMPSQDVGEAAEKDSEALQTIISRANFKQFVFKLRSKMESYNDESRLKTVAMKIDDIDHKEYNNYLIDRIQQLTNITL